MGIVTDTRSPSFSPYILARTNLARPHIPHSTIYNPLLPNASWHDIN